MKTLMIVDDSRIFQKLIEKILSPHFKVVGTATSGDEGVSLFQKLKPDLVLMDIVMPNSTGKEGLKGILDSDPNALVVMVSSLGDDQTVQDCLKLGAKAFIRKDQITSNDDANSVLVQTTLKIFGITKNASAA